MLVELSKEDLICLVKGMQPSYEQMEHPLCKSEGSYNASYGFWSWNYSAFIKQSEEDLWEFYHYLKMPKLQKVDVSRQQVVNEIWATYYQAKAKGNIFVQTACQEELMRMEEWK